MISIHALLAESDPPGLLHSLGGVISIHALLAESDFDSSFSIFWICHFYPRSPCGERHPKMSDHPHNTNFYPRSPCGERRRESSFRCVLSGISIHALLAESDSHLSKFNTSQRVFLSTLSLRRATFLHCTTYLNCSLFLSTLSLRRATVAPVLAVGRAGYFYPRSPCGERLTQTDLANRTKLFLSTLSLRRATHYDNYNLHCVEISIHALLAESDTSNRITSNL